MHVYTHLFYSTQLSGEISKQAKSILIQVLQPAENKHTQTRVLAEVLHTCVDHQWTHRTGSSGEATKLFIHINSLEMLYNDLGN